MRIAVIGAGKVGKALGTALRAKGYSVTYGVRQPHRSPERNAKTVGEALNSGDVVILATPWTAAEAIVCEHAESLGGKIVIDATNPLNPNATGLAFGFVTSGAELLQSHARTAIFYKAFNSTGTAAMVKPQFAEGRAAMFVAGPDLPEKYTVLRLVAEIGFEPIDAGELKAARLLEPLGMLWLQLAQNKGEGRDFAFVVARRGGDRIQDSNGRVKDVRHPQEAK